ncbi:MAG: PIN domain-containing protein [Candidatus Pacebacteria bacterium]|nr:PIN domain-containing protein [Candidatus Paceibacterota bacterium]
MKIYLDNSALNRPFDNQSSSQIRLETVAMFFIFEFIEKGKIKLVNSSVVEYENSKNPFLERKIWISAYLANFFFYQELNLKIKERAMEMANLKISSIDSLHLSSAEAARVDYFITCDYDIIKRYKGSLKVMNPVDFIQLLKFK